VAQCPVGFTVPDQTISSGIQSFSDPNSLRANQVIINGSAKVSFMTPHCISLGTGFRATAGAAATTFHAWLRTLPGANYVSPSGGTGYTHTFTWTVSGSITNIHALFNTTTSGVNGCYVIYTAGSPGFVTLLKEDATSAAGGFVIGNSTGVADNSACTISGAGSSDSTGVGDQRYLVLPVSFKPTFGGVKNVYLKADNANDGASSGWQQVGQWEVASSSPLSITTGSLPNGTSGSSYSSVVNAIGGTGAHTWSLASGSLPSGLTLASGGTISGTPSSSGQASFNVRVTDSVGASVVRALTIAVVAPLTVVTMSLPAGVVSSAYSSFLAASGGQSYTWTSADGSLPSGLSLSSTTGGITGIPTHAGVSNFTAQVTDNLGRTAFKALSISVTSGVAITTTSLPPATVGVAYIRSLAVAGGVSPFSWAVVGGALPAGLSLSSNSIIGTPLTSGTASFTAQVTDGAGAIASKALSITVIRITMTAPNCTVGAACIATLTATGGSSPYNWTLVGGSLPVGLSLSSNTISGTPLVAGGPSNFTISVLDSSGRVAVRALSINVASGTGSIQSRDYIRMGGRVLAIEQGSSPPVMFCTPINTGVVSTAFNSGAPTISGGAPPYIFSLATGSLYGLTLDTSTGVISGTSTVAGPFSVQVRDAGSLTAAVTCSYTMFMP
jgi:hypothetical protein